MLLQMSLIMLAEKCETSPPIFVFCMTFHVHRVCGQARVSSMYPRRWLSLSSQAKAFTLQGGHIDVSSVILHSIPLFVELISLSATQQM